jgi:integrase
MATFYKRPDSQQFSVACYPRPGAKLVRASLGTDDPALAEKITRKVEILCELEKLADVPVPEKILASFACMTVRVEREAASTTRPAPVQAVPEPSPVPNKGGSIPDAIRAYLVRSAATNVPQATADKISRLRQFFGSALIDSLDPRPPDKLKHARKCVILPLKGIAPKCLSDLTPDLILSFLLAKNYGLCSKRHYRELFHGLFDSALKSGIYQPPNPYAPNPADDLPSFNGRDKPIIVLTDSEVTAQYAAVAANPLVIFGCQLMLEGGFRLHEILALRRCDLAVEGKIRLILPEIINNVGTGLKTGERTVTARHILRSLIRQYLESNPGPATDWIFQSATGLRMTTDAFGTSLRTLNRAAKLKWTTQHFRHTFATQRIAEGWNLKTLAQEMGTSVTMLMAYYSGHIDPPILAAESAGLGSVQMT